MDRLWDLLRTALAQIQRYPQPQQARPSVQFVPVPYRRAPPPAPRARSEP